MITAEMIRMRIIVEGTAESIHEPDRFVVIGGCGVGDGVAISIPLIVLAF